MNKERQNSLRELPSVDTLLKTSASETLITRYGHDVVTNALRDTLSKIREEIINDKSAKLKATAESSILTVTEKELASKQQPRLKRVVNAAGIILHTGMGRAVMSPVVAKSLSQLTGCCNIQMDLKTGARVKREHCIRDLVCELTGAEEALLVNNNAAATLLVLSALATNREVIVSRGELIEIGGSFRLPDIMSQSGAKLKEVGSTNKTHARDYENAISSETALLLKVHKSNYEINGFTKEVTIDEIAAIGKKHKIPVVDDLGCGALVNLEQYGLGHEMTVRESLANGADLALFSTDKLIGGPQGGLIVGRGDLLAKIRKDPLYRAFRVGKMTLAALEATLRLFRAPELLPQYHPVYAMLAKSLDEIKIQAEDVADKISNEKPDWQVTVAKTSSRLGGGALPGSSIPSYAVQISATSESVNDISLKMRNADVPIVSHITDDSVLLDMRTVSAEEIEDIINACRNSD